MKSVIDWNEIVPMLPKSLRDTLMLEAVMLLSKQSGPHVPERRSKRGPGGSNGGKRDDLGERSWKLQGDGKVLSSIGRRYRVNKAVENPPSRGKIGAVWKHLIESKNDVITYEGLASICKGQQIAASTMICQLWERGFIDVDEKKVAVAY